MVELYEGTASENSITWLNLLPDTNSLHKVSQKKETGAGCCFTLICIPPFLNQRGVTEDIKGCSGYVYSRGQSFYFFIELELC